MNLLFQQIDYQHLTQQNNLFFVHLFAQDSGYSSIFEANLSTGVDNRSSSLLFS